MHSRMMRICPSHFHVPPPPSHPYSCLLVDSGVPATPSLPIQCALSLLNQSVMPHSSHYAAPLPPHPCGRLFVSGGVPVGVKQDQPVAADEVQAAAARLAAQQEHKLAGQGVVEDLRAWMNMGALGSVHGGTPKGKV